MAKTYAFEIGGMSCDHCVRAVREALEGVPGVESVRVQLDPGRAWVVGEAGPAALTQAVVAAGYRAEPLAEG